MMLILYSLMADNYFFIDTYALRLKVKIRLNSTEKRF